MILQYAFDDLRHAVVRTGGRNDFCNSPDVLHGVFHGHGPAGFGQHVQIVDVVAESHGFFAADAQMFRQPAHRLRLAAASRHGVAVANTPGGNAESVAQYAVAMMLDVGLCLSRYDRQMRALDYSRRNRPFDLIGKTVGLVGFGNIAKNVAKLLRGFGVNILAYVRHPDYKAAEELGVTFADLDTLARESDFVSLHVPLTDVTRGMIDREFFRKMKNSAYLINTCRGGVVVEEDLIHALESGAIAGAGLDVYETSPLKEDSPLLQMENVVHTPYVAFSSELGNSRTMEMALESISDYLAGRDIRRILNPGYIRN